MSENNTAAQSQTVNQLKVTLMHFSTKPSVTGNESEQQKEDAQALAKQIAWGFLSVMTCKRGKLPLC